jgi:hypothetical protein
MAVNSFAGINSQEAALGEAATASHANSQKEAKRRI